MFASRLYVEETVERSTPKVSGCDRETPLFLKRWTELPDVDADGWSEVKGFAGFDGEIAGGEVQEGGEVG